MRRILISAEAQIDRRPLSLESMYYPTLLGAYARAVRGVAVLIAAVPAEHRENLRQRLEIERVADGISLVDVLPAAADGDIQIDLCDVYFPSVLRACARSGRSLGAPAWKVRELADLPRAAATLERYDMYIVARYVVIPVAKWLAHKLLPSQVSPNSVTAASCLFGVVAAVLPFLIGGWHGRVLSALCIHASITLDFTDGYLARLRGTDSRLGYWFDTVMDEVVKFALFITMVAVVMRDGPYWALLPGIVAIWLYHVLTCNHWLSKSLEHGDVTLSASTTPCWRPGTIGLAQRAYERLNYLDVHLYLVAAGIITGGERYVLSLFAGVYAFRFVRMLQVRLTRPTAAAAATARGGSDSG